ncbi:hypothetical protein AB0F81_18190 [Actinoplanes sp. NPDC024001]|uniref:hypothetical protein n=1 Tax=Actinoplanes sp. NPDC024001 TaxID=3154598 RepID=UPI0033E43E12
MIWQRFSAHRKLVAANGGRWASWRVPAARNTRTATGLAAPMIREPEAGWWHDSVTVAVIRAHEIRDDSGSAVARLAVLAEDDEDELLVVVGASAMRADHRSVITGLRDRLPGHRVVEVPVWHGEDGFRSGAAVAERLLADRALPVVVTPGTLLHTISAQISSYLRADRVLRVLRTASGAELYEVWSRRPEAALN